MHFRTKALSGTPLFRGRWGFDCLIPFGEDCSWEVVNRFLVLLVLYLTVVYLPQPDASVAKLGKSLEEFFTNIVGGYLPHLEKEVTEPIKWYEVLFISIIRW